MAAEFGAVGVHAPLTPNDVSVRERERAREGEKRESARAREKRERERERRARAIHHRADQKPKHWNPKTLDTQNLAGNHAKQPPFDGCFCSS